MSAFTSEDGQPILTAASLSGIHSRQQSGKVRERPLSQCTVRPVGPSVYSFFEGSFHATSEPI